MTSLRTLLRDARYALPEKIEPFCRGPGIAATARRCERLDDQGLTATVGFFQSSDSGPDSIVAANLAILNQWKSASRGAYLSVKAPPLRFDPQRLNVLAAASAKKGLALLLDAHSPEDAAPTLRALEDLLPDYPETGFALPARWRRSQFDADRLRESGSRLRIVKGEWPDGTFSDDVVESYLALVDLLRGRQAPVAIATHDPELAERALILLLEAGTPCELEQLRGLPRKRTSEVANRLGVPIRIYVPFGPGWWPYALDKALARPYLLSWMITDRLSRSVSSQQGIV